MWTKNQRKTDENRDHSRSLGRRNMRTLLFLITHGSRLFRLKTSLPNPIVKAYSAALSQEDGQTCSGPHDGLGRVGQILRNLSCNTVGLVMMLYEGPRDVHRSQNSHRRQMGGTLLPAPARNAHQFWLETFCFFGGGEPTTTGEVDARIERPRLNRSILDFTVVLGDQTRGSLNIS